MGLASARVRATRRPGLDGRMVLLGFRSSSPAPWCDVIWQTCCTWLQLCMSSRAPSVSLSNSSKPFAYLREPKTGWECRKQECLFTCAAFLSQQHDSLMFCISKLIHFSWVICSWADARRGVLPAEIERGKVTLSENKLCKFAGFGELLCVFCYADKPVFPERASLSLWLTSR